MIDKQQLKGWIGRWIEPQGRLWRVCFYPWHVLGRSTRLAKQVYRHATRNSIFYSASEMPMCSLQHPQKLDMMLAIFAPRSVLDVGCGVGWSLDYLLGREVDAFGIEGSSLAISQALHPERIVQRDLNAEVNLERRFDLVWCIEVVEHIHPKYVGNLMKTFLNHSDRVVLSAARPGQGGEGHFNEQLPEYWISIFDQYGFQYDAKNTEKLRALPEKFCRNVLVFFRNTGGQRQEASLSGKA